MNYFRPAARVVGVWLTVMLLLGLTPPAEGGQIISAVVEHEDGRFIVQADLLVNVPEPRTRAILTRYQDLPKINSGIKNVQILDSDAGGRIRMRVEASGCILFICLTYRWVQDARVLPSGDIMTVFDPAQSDFRSGHVTYRLLPAAEHTRLVMHAEIVPDFWFPPLIGPWLIKRKLRKEALETATGIERVAATPDPSKARRETLTMPDHGRVPEGPPPAGLLSADT
jgi:hypothetical protein